MDEDCGIDSRMSSLLKPKSTKIVDIVEIDPLENSKRENGPLSERNSLSTDNSTVNVEQIKKNRRISFADKDQIQQQSKKIIHEDEGIYIRFHHSSQPTEQFLSPKLEAPIKTVRFFKCVF